MKLIIGLGNPGKKYQNTRHNIGFIVIDNMIGKEQITMNNNKKMLSETAQGDISGKKVLLAKPQTYMNESGRAARAVMDYYKLTPADMIVIHDDKDLPLGDIRVHAGRSSAGHLGVQSIIDCLGTKDFTRVRVGVARSDPKMMGDTSDFVLGKFSKEEKNIVEEVIKKAVEKIIGLIKP